MNKQYLKEIYFLIGDNKRKLPLVGGLFILLSMFDLAGIGLIAPYVTLISSPEIFLQSRYYEIYEELGLSLQLGDIILNFGIVLISIFLMKAIAAIFINFILLRFCHGRSVALRASLMNSYQGLPYIEYVQRNSSSYIHNINLADKFATGTLLAMLRVICDGTVVIAIIIFLGVTDISALMVLGGLLLTLAIFYDRYFKPKVTQYGEIANLESIQILKSIQEAILGLKEVRVLRKENYFFSSMYESAKRFADVSVKTSVVNLAPRFIIEVAMVTFVVFLVLSTMYTDKNFSELIPLLSMFGVASLKLAPATTSIISGLSKMRFYRNAVSLVYKDVVGINEIKNDYSHNNYSKDESFESIVLKNIEFNYPNTKKPAINNFSIDINKSDIIGFIGSSGSGKTTLIDIILGLLQPQNGEIYYNGEKLDKVLMEKWRSSVAYLPQDVFLIDDTLERNIALGVYDNEIDKTKVKNAILKSRLTSLVDDLPMGLETIVGERGVKLSGGQRQRISLARAFYHEREVLVMDESTSALDNKTEQEIVNEISHLKGEKTIIVIAHRITTLQHCNVIYRLDNGYLSEKLTYNEIIDD
jgi:ATP-binding cassette, subfamily B, bacterial PglK